MSRVVFISAFTSLLILGSGIARADDRRPADLERGDDQFRAGYYLKAAEIYRRAYKKRPKDPRCATAFAGALFALGNYHYAAHALRRHAQRSSGAFPKDGLIERFPTRLAYQRARDDLERFLRSNRRDPAALTTLAYVSFVAGDKEKAKSLCVTLTILDRDDPFARAVLRALEPAKKRRSI